MNAKLNRTIWLVRFAVVLVCVWNLTAAIPFMITPERFTSGFAVDGCGIGGEVMVRGLGIAFLMWQIPYFPVIFQPHRQRTAFLCILAMQVVGLVGESMMLVFLPGTNPALEATALRFIAFDGAGLLVLVIAYGVIQPISQKIRST